MLEKTSSLMIVMALPCMMTAAYVQASAPGTLDIRFDANADTNAELIIGAYGHDPVDLITLKPVTDAGSVYIYSSASPYTLVAELNGSTRGNYFGYSVSAVDTGADGFIDVLVGSPKADILNSITLKMMRDAGKVQVFNDTSGAALYSVDGTQAGALFGQSVSNGADIDNLGADDFVVGSPKMDITLGAVMLRDAGRVEIPSGASTN